MKMTHVWDMENWEAGSEVHMHVVESTGVDVWMVTKVMFS